VPYADIIADATNSIASAAPQLIDVQWTDAALQQAHGHAQRLGEPLVELIEQCLAQDPRPAYQTPAPEREYGSSGIWTCAGITRRRSRFACSK
jgi:hypothetical protein